MRSPTTSDEKDDDMAQSTRQGAPHVPRSCRASAGGLAACAPKPPPVLAAKGGAAWQTPARRRSAPSWSRGKLDDYYLFYSGGHSGQVYVAGVPSMRHIATIPVFAPYPATGYGFDEESKKLLGSYTWGDMHHPALSKAKGDYDGRWLFVNDNANNRLARIDLRDFKTKQILGPHPELQRQPRLGLRDREHRVRPGGKSVLDPGPARQLCPAEQICDRIPWRPDWGQDR